MPLDLTPLSADRFDDWLEATRARLVTLRQESGMFVGEDAGSHVDAVLGDLVTAGRIHLVRLRGDLAAQPEPVRGAGVVEDEFLIQVLQVAHAPLRKKSIAPWTPSSTASVSAWVVYR